METPNKHKQRLTGIDLFRSIAICSVVILHSDEGISQQPFTWTIITEFSGFAVPFFLATSFYLAFNKIYTTAGRYSLKERLTRLLVPYLFWTALYISYKLLKYLLQGEVDNINKLFHDPVALLFFGGAAFHLYFLPLLILGTILVKPISSLLKKQTSIICCLLLSVLSLVMYQIIVSSSNLFDNTSSIAFQNLLNSPYLFQVKDNLILRILLNGIAMSIRCFPYIFIAMILSFPKVRDFLFQKNSIIYSIFWITGFLLINTFGGYFLPESIHELSRGYLALVLGISLSNHLQQNKTISSLSLCSFGIYLIHLLFVETFQIVESRIYPGGALRVSTPNLLIFALLSLAFSWIATDILMRKKLLAKLMFGI